MASQPTTNSAGRRAAFDGEGGGARPLPVDGGGLAGRGRSGGAAGSAPSTSSRVGSGGRSIPSGPGSGGPSGELNARAADPALARGSRGRPVATGSGSGRAGRRPTAAPSGSGGGRRCAAGRGDPAGGVTSLRQRLDGRGRDLAALEVLAAPGAQRPVHADQPAAVRADPLQSGPAGRADDPFIVDPALARRAVVDRLDLGEEGLLGQVALPDLADLLVRAGRSCRSRRRR